MDWTSGAVLAVSLAMTTAAPANLRLTAQKAEGTRRICTYGSGSDAKVKRIGVGEPCPAVYRAPPPRVEMIPSMALRIGEGRSNGQAYCLYRYGGRDYRTLRPAMTRCPLTPSARMQALADPTVDERYRR